MIPARQIALVQDSFAQVLPIAAQAASFFYERLFDLAPDTRLLFRGARAQAVPDTRFSCRWVG
jgi:hypothetical protein